MPASDAVPTVFLSFAASASAYTWRQPDPAAAHSRSAAIQMMAAADPLGRRPRHPGAFSEHMDALERQPGVEGVEVRTPFELAGVDALILPGGESTAIGNGLVDARLLDDVKDFVAAKPAWGICAG